MPAKPHTPHDIDSLSSIIERLETTASTLRTTAASMKRKEITTIQVQYQKELERGMKGIENFAHSAMSGLHAILTKRGQYRGEDE